jgi:hypothetical protein
VLSLEWSNMLNLWFFSFVFFVVAVIPGLLNFLQYFDESRGLIWLLLHQLYYYPFGCWVREPFFEVDSEIGFNVLILGRILTGFVYVAVTVIFRSVTRKFFRKKGD